MKLVVDDQENVIAISTFDKDTQIHVHITESMYDSLVGKTGSFKIAVKRIINQRKNHNECE